MGCTSGGGTRLLDLEERHRRRLRDPAQIAPVSRPLLVLGVSLAVSTAVGVAEPKEPDQPVVDGPYHLTVEVAVTLLAPDPRPPVRLEQLQRELNTPRRVVPLARLGGVEPDVARCLVLTKPDCCGLTMRIGAPWSLSRGALSRCSARST